MAGPPAGLETRDTADWGVYATRGGSARMRPSPPALSLLCRPHATGSLARDSGIGVPMVRLGKNCHAFQFTRPRPHPHA